MNRLGTMLSRKAVVGLAAVLLVAFGAFGFPPMVALLDASTPEGGEFDTELFYTPAQAIEKASLFSPAGRAGSIRAHWSWDLAFPLAYGFFCAAAWAFGLRLLAGTGRQPRYLFLLVPLAGSFFDVFENAAVSVLLAADPAGPVLRAAAVAAAIAASDGTALKWLFVVPAFSGAIVLPVAGLTAAFVLRRSANRPA